MKKVIIITVTFFTIIAAGVLTHNLYKSYKIKNAKIIVNLKDNLNVEVFDNIKLSDLLQSINGKLINDFKIDTTHIGKKTINFEFINDENIKVSYSFDIYIVDKIAPLIFSSNSFTINVGYTGDLSKELFCGDNYDAKPKCELIGQYDVNTPGTYNLTFKATDSSNNVSNTNFKLIVKEKSTNQSTNTNINSTQDFNNLKNIYKNNYNKIGIDVSKWQGEIDFQKVKEAGVEFVFIRIGSQKGINGEYYIDPNFEQNIIGFKKVNIPVGVYFYSYADNVSEAKKQAKWVIEQLKPYKIELPIAFDWESWGSFQDFNISFYNLTEIANAFINTIEKSNYTGMLYSSKYYLENVWFKTSHNIWLAHYTNQTNYQGSYNYWQLCNNGRVDGIKGNVDINVFNK